MGDSLWYVAKGRDMVGQSYVVPKRPVLYHLPAHDQCGVRDKHGGCLGAIVVLDVSVPMSKFVFRGRAGHICFLTCFLTLPGTDKYVDTAFYVVDLLTTQNPDNQRR